MKNLKLSFALIVAILAVGVTVATKANPFGKRVLTRCFTVLTVQNAAQTQSASLSDILSCDQAKAHINAGRKYVTAASEENSLADQEECPIDIVQFCCVKLTATSNTAATPLDLGEGLQRYEVASSADVFCKP